MYVDSWNSWVPRPRIRLSMGRGLVWSETFTWRGEQGAGRRQPTCLLHLLSVPATAALLCLGVTLSAGSESGWPVLISLA